MTEPLTNSQRVARIAKILEGSCTTSTARHIAKAAVELAFDPPRLVDGDQRRLDWPTRCFGLALKLEEMRQGAADV